MDPGGHPLEGEQISIHYRRRWYYVLWSCLLLASLIALVLWETPSPVGTVNVQMNIAIKDLPEGCQFSVWAGPRRSWHGNNLVESQAGRIIPPDGKVVESLVLPVAYRRWGGGYIPRRTSDFIVLVFMPPSGEPHYLALPLDTDLRTGFLRLGRKMTVSLGFHWRRLGTDRFMPPLFP
jgi:hypothetical protein